MLFDGREGEKKIFKCSVRNKTSKLNFLVRDQISFVGAQAKFTPVVCCFMDAREKKRIFKCSVRNKTSKLNFLVRDKISFVGAQAKVTPVAHGGRCCS